MKKIQHFLAFIPMLAFIMVSCTKADDPYSPETRGGTYTTTGGQSTSAEVKCPEGTMSFNLTNSNSLVVIGGRLFISKSYNFSMSTGEFARIGMINGLSALNINNLPTNGWADEMSCDEGWTYILRCDDKCCGIYVSKILADGAQIWYCPFTPKKSWNQ